MAGTYDHEERERIRREMDEAAHWIDARPSDPPANHPEAVIPATGRIYFLTPSRIDDVDFPLGSGSLAIGRPHDRAEAAALDRRKANCPFVLAARTGASSPHGVALATLLEQLRMSLDISVRDQWREIREMELFSIDVRDVRVAVRTRHPAMREGLEGLRRASSGDPQFDGLEGPADAGVGTGTVTASKEALSPAWMAVRSAVGELHAPIIYLGTPFISPGAGYVFAVHPLETLKPWGLVGFTHHGTLREAGIRFFSRQTLAQRDPDRGDALVWPRQVFPLFAHFARRKVYAAAGVCKRGWGRIRSGLGSLLGLPRILAAVDYLEAWAALARAARLLTRELRLLIVAVAVLAIAVLALVSGRL